MSLTLGARFGTPFAAGSDGALDHRAPDFGGLDDLALVELARRGRHDAFDELVRRHAPRAHAVAARIVRRDDAQDVVQDAFVAALRALPGFRRDAQFATWLHRIVLNASYAHLRRRPAGQVELGDVDPAATSAGPVDAAERGDLGRALERALGEILPEFRETFVLVEYGGLDQAQAAEALGVAVGTVKSRLSRARRALRELLESRGYRP